MPNVGSSAITPALCPSCLVQISPQFEAYERQFGQPGVFNYGQCAGCDALVLINPPEDMALYYSRGYYSFTDDLPARSLKRRFIGLVSGNLPAAIRWIPNKHARVLDVGCGGGHLVRELRIQGYQKVEGIDPFLDDSKASTAPELKLRRARLEEISDDYDVIMYNHVLEHVADPFTELANAKKRLLPGGKIIVRVPLADSILFRQFRENWYQLDAPRHLWIPSRKAMTTLVRRLDLQLRATEEDATVAAFLLSRLLAKNRQLPGGLLRSYRNPLRFPVLAWSHVQTVYSRLRRLGDQACFVIENSR